MKVLTDKITNVIFAISNRADIVSNGILLDDSVLGIPLKKDKSFEEEYIPNIKDVSEIPMDVVPYKYTYDGTAFKINSNYTEPIDEKAEIRTLKQENSELKQQLEVTNQAIAEITMMITPSI